jgi:hypothetical protein
MFYKFVPSYEFKLKLLNEIKRLFKIKLAAYKQRPMLIFRSSISLLCCSIALNASSTKPFKTITAFIRRPSVK